MTKDADVPTVVLEEPTVDRLAAGADSPEAHRAPRADDLGDSIHGDVDQLEQRPRSRNEVFDVRDPEPRGSMVDHHRVRREACTKPLGIATVHGRHERRERAHVRRRVIPAGPPRARRAPRTRRPRRRRRRSHRAARAARPPSPRGARASRPGSADADTPDGRARADRRVSPSSSKWSSRSRRPASHCALRVVS